MNRFEGALGAQVDTLLDGIGRDLAERKQTIRQEAERDAELLLRLTRHRCRQRGQRAVAEERARMARALSRTEAALASRRRRHQQAIDTARLACGLEWLRTALLSRWADKSTQRDWVETAVSQAATMLDPDGWQVEVAHQTDETIVQAALASRSIDAAPVAMPSIEAGLRIRRGSACLDMTLHGLLVNESRLAEELLDDLNKLQQDSGEHRHG